MDEVAVTLLPIQQWSKHNDTIFTEEKNEAEDEDLI